MSKNVGKALNKESDFCCLLADTVIKSETVRGDYMQLVQDIYKIIEYSQKMTSKNLKSHLFNLEFDRKKIV